MEPERWPLVAEVGSPERLAVASAASIPGRSLEREVRCLGAEDGSPARSFVGRRRILHVVASITAGVPLLLLWSLAPAAPGLARHRVGTDLLGLAGSGPRAVALARFLTNDAINGRYVERFGPEYTVNDHATFWSELDFFIYWCPYQNMSKWLVSWNGTLEEVRHKRICHYVAASPPGADLFAASAAQRWSEWDPATKSMALRPQAGTEAVSSHEESLAGRRRTFSSAERWPSCGDAFASRVRTQTKECDNCWAAAVAQVLEWRLCISAPDAFRGPSAFISVGYITSCAREAYSENGTSTGCDGGSPLSAMRWAAANGVPTGGDGNNFWTCVPDFFDGISSLVRRAKGSARVPSCPTSCTSKRYNRSLQEDLFVPEGWNESWVTTAFDSAAIAIRQSGPIVIGFPVDRQFLSAYVPGSIYHYRAEEHLFDHLAVAIGFGPDYIEAVNSWGLGWGRLGRFRIHKDSVRSYAIPGDLRGRGPGYPYPLPRQGARYLVVAGFKRRGMNARYTEMERFIVNGNRAYFEASNNYFLYWCHLAKRFAIAGVRSLPEIRKGRSCRYWALAPPGTEVSELGQDWLELDEERLHAVAQSGSGVVDFEFNGKYK